MATKTGANSHTLLADVNDALALSIALGFRKSQKLGVGRGRSDFRPEIDPHVHQFIPSIGEYCLSITLFQRFLLPFPIPMILTIP